MTHTYAGPVAEAVFFDEEPMQVRDSHEDDNLVVRECVAWLRSKGLVEPEVMKYRHEAWQAALGIVEKERSAIKAVALALSEKGSLTGCEIEEIRDDVKVTKPRDG
jgi:hypothetical protein